MSRSIVYRLLVAVALLALPFILGSAAFAAPTTQAGTVIEMEDNYFEPKTLTVPVGTTITWQNTGQNPHTATADDQSWDTGRVNSGQSASITFNTPGTFPYYCQFHGGPGGVGMAGTITVEAAQASPQPTPSPPPSGVTPSLTVNDQPIVNNTITVAQVVAAQDGWVAVHKFGPDGQMLLTPLAGLAPVTAGTSTNVQVTLNEPFAAGAKLAPMLHVDEGVKGTYEFPNGPDVPVSVNGQVVVQTFTVQAISQAPATMPDTGLDGTRRMVLGVIAACALLAGIGLQRGVHRRMVTR